MSFEGAKGPLTGIVWIEQTAQGWRMHDLGGPEGIKYDLVLLLDVDGDLDVVTTNERAPARARVVRESTQPTAGSSCAGRPWALIL